MKIGLALSGGGTRAMAHIGVMHALRLNDIPIDMVSGASGGALIAGMAACGYGYERMKRIALQADGKLLDYDFFGIFKTMITCLKGDCDKMDGLIKGKRLRRFLNKAYCGRYIQEAELPVCINAVDLACGYSIYYCDDKEGLKDKNTIIYKDKVLLADAALASAAIPAIFRPVKLDSFALIDGGITDNLPVNVLKLRGCDIVIAVDLSSLICESIPDGMIATASRGLEITLATLKRRHKANVVIYPKVSDVGLLSFDKIEETIDRGFAVGIKAIPTIKKVINGQKSLNSYSIIRS